MDISPLPLHPDAKALILAILQQNSMILEQNLVILETNARLLDSLRDLISAPLMQITSSLEELEVKV